MVKIIGFIVWKSQEKLNGANLVILRFVSKKRRRKISYHFCLFQQHFWHDYIAIIRYSACSIHEKLRIFLFGLIISDKSDKSVVCFFNQMIGFVLREKEGRSYSSQTINSLSRGIKISVPMIPVEHIGEGAVDAAPLLHHHLLAVATKIQILSE